MRILPLLVVLILFAQCTIERRVHRKGWHVEWKKTHFKKNTAAKQMAEVNDQFRVVKNEKNQLKNTTEISSRFEKQSDSSDQVEERVSLNELSLNQQSVGILITIERLVPEDSTYFDKVKKDRTIKKENNATNKVFIIVAISLLALLLLAIVLFQVLSTTQQGGALLALGLIIVGFALLIAAVATLIIFLIYKFSSGTKKDLQNETIRQEENNESDTTLEDQTTSKEDEISPESSSQEEKQTRKFIPWIFGGIAAIFVVGYLLLSK